MSRLPQESLYVPVTLEHDLCVYMKRNKLVSLNEQRTVCMYLLL